MSSNEDESNNPGIPDTPTPTLACHLFPCTSTSGDSPPQPTSDEEKICDDDLLTLLSLDLPKPEISDVQPY